MNNLGIEPFIKGALIGVVSLGTYGVATQEHTSLVYYDKETGKTVLKEHIMKKDLKSRAKTKVQTDEQIFFGISNALAQIFIPKITDDEVLQRILLNTVVSSFATLLYKDSKGKSSTTGAALKLYLASVTASALIVLPFNKLIK